MPFKTLPFLNTEGDGRRLATFKPGKIICRAGDIARHVYYLRSGQAKVTMRNDGSAVLISLVNPDEFFGDLVREDENGTLTATCTAITECEVTIIDRKAMARQLRKDHKFGQAYTDHVVNRGGKLFQQIANLRFLTVDERLATALLALSNNGTTIISNDFNQQALAEIVQTQRSRINFFMTRFRKHGCIDYGPDGIRVNAVKLIEMLSKRKAKGRSAVG